MIIFCLLTLLGVIGILIWLILESDSMIGLYATIISILALVAIYFIYLIIIGLQAKFYLIEGDKFLKGVETEIRMYNKEKLRF